MTQHLAHLLNPSNPNPLRTLSDGRVAFADSANLGTGERQPGRCVQLDGVSQYGTAGRRVTSGAATALSVVAWVNPDTVIGTYMIASEFYHATNERAWVLYLVNGKVTVVLSDDGTAATGHYKNHNSIAAVPLDEWSLVAFTFAAGILTLYVNGVATNVTKVQDAAITSLHDTSANYVVGERHLTYTNEWSGKLFGVAVTQSEITAAQHLALYEQGLRPERWTGIYREIPWAALHWLDDDSQATARDASGNGNDLTWAAGDAGMIYTGKDVPFSPQNRLGFTEA